MITARGWWFLVTVLSLLSVGLFDDRWPLALIGLTLSAWFLGEWLLFTLRARFAVPALSLARELRDERGPVDTLWAGRVFDVAVDLMSHHPLGLPHVKLADFVPLSVEKTRGASAGEAALAPGGRHSLSYSIRCPAAGRVRFEGVSVRLADVQGFFYHEAFVPGVQEYRVLPPLADAEGRRPTVKRNNILPSPGLHRHLRPGSGSELLDLRDYLPGDPPKTIAWKVSARRDRLITKEFESEVPIRCTLFVDASQSVRVGPPGRNALARLVEVGAAVGQASVGARDLVGLCVFDEQAVTSYTRPGRGPRHVVGLLNTLADAAGLAPATGEARVATLLPLGYALAQEIHPDLLAPGRNRVPMRVPWLWPLPTYGRERVGRARRIFRFFFYALAYLPFLAVALLFYIFREELDAFMPAFLLVPEPMIDVIKVSVALTSAGLYFGLVTLAYRALGQVVGPTRRRLARWRKQLAAILAVEYDLGPGGLAALLEQDRHFVAYVQRFLAQHQVPYPLPLYDRRGRYLFASPGKVDVLATALVRAVGKGHDNELFVLLVDLLELVDRLDPLLRAVKMTLARHHQVLVICPWPPGVPGPGEPAVAYGAAGPGAARTAHGAAAALLRQAFQRLRHAFARLGVPVVCAAEGDPVRLVLERVNRLRYLGVGRRA